MSKRKIILSFIFFILLTALGIWFSFYFNQNFKLVIPALSKIPPFYYLILLSFSFFIYAADVIRFILFAKAFGVKIPIKVAIDAVIACLFFGWITPGATLGAPAGAYILKKSGIPLEASIAISVGKSMTGISFLLLIAMTLIFFGYGPNFQVYQIGPIIFTTFLILFIFIILPLIARIFNKKIVIFLKTKKYTKGIIKVINQIDFLFTAPKKILILAFLSHILYFLMFITPAALLCLHFKANFLAGFNHSLIYTAFSYIAPTPGGAGLAEAASSIFYNKLLSASEAILVVLIFRFFTFYFQIYFGAFYLLVIKKIKFNFKK